MDFETPVALTIGEVLLAMGGAGTLVMFLFGWLLKVWFDRLVASESAKQATKLEELRASQAQALETLRNQLKSDADRKSHLFEEKIALYKMVGNPLIDMVARAKHLRTMTIEEAVKLDAERMKGAALLAMFGPASLFEEYNKVVDYLYDARDGVHPWSFPEFRAMSLRVLNLMRADVGLQADQVSYTGHR